MQKRPRPSSPVPTPTLNGRPLVMRAVRRKRPDLDTFVAALLAATLRQVEAEQSPTEDRDG